MGRIKILHFVSSLSKSSGVMSVIMNYYRHIDIEKVQFDFLYFKDLDNTYEEEIKKNGGITYKVCKPSFKKNFKNELSDILSKDNYSALHIHEVYLTFLLAPIAKKNGISNIITHSHTTVYSEKTMNSIRNRISCLRLKKHANYYFACSKLAGEFLYGKGILNNSNFWVINNAIDLEKFSYCEKTRDKVKKNLGLESNFVVGHVGRFSKAKNHVFLVNVFKEIIKKRKDSKLILIGEGDLESEVKEIVKEQGIDNDVLFLGPRSDVNEIMQAMDVFLFPSLSEGLGVALIEAQASGLFSIASEVVPKEVKITDLLMFLDLNDDPKIWANVLLDLPCIDRTLRQDNIKKSVFNIEIEALKLQQIYLQMV